MMSRRYRSVSRSRKSSKNHFVVTVGVVGLPFNECDNTSAVGKSSFCSRFVRPAYDDYEAVKGSLSSCISESDFAHPVINNAHFLYYPAVCHSLEPPGRSDAGSARNVTFHVIEQTTFINDATFKPFLGSGSYVDRATQKYLRSEGKLAYTSRDAIGDDSSSRDATEFPNECFRRTGVKGFVCVYDPTVRGVRKQDQEMVVCQLIKRIKSKVKVPVVLAVLKCDLLQTREPENECNIAQAREIAKRFGIPLTFVSAHTNVNVTKTFLTLAKMVLGKKVKGVVQMNVEYKEADEDRLLISQQTEKDYGMLLSSMVRDHCTTWSSLLLKLESRIAYEKFVYMLGKGQAKRAFQLRILQLVIEECKVGLHTRNNLYDVSRAAKQEAVRDILQEHDDFHEIGDLEYEFIAFAGDIRARQRSIEDDYEPEPVERLHMLSKMTKTQSHLSAPTQPTEECSSGECCGKQPDTAKCSSLHASEEWYSSEDDDYEKIEDDRNSYEDVDSAPMLFEGLGRGLSTKMASTQSQASAASKPNIESSTAYYSAMQSDDRYYVPMLVKSPGALSEDMAGTQRQLSAASEPNKKRSNICAMQPGDCFSLETPDKWSCSYDYEDMEEDDEEHDYEDMEEDDESLYETVE